MQAMPGDDEREHQRRAGLVVRRHAGQHEDAGADDRADAQARQLQRAEHAAQAVLARHLLQDDFERLARERGLLMPGDGRGVRGANASYARDRATAAALGRIVQPALISAACRCSRAACSSRWRVAFLLDQLGRRARQELGVAELALDRGQVLLELLQLALQPLALLVHVDQARQRHDQRHALGDRDRAVFGRIACARRLRS